MRSGPAPIVGCLFLACASSMLSQVPGGAALSHECADGSGAACRSLAVLIERIDGGNAGELLPLFRQSCEKNSSGCSSLAALLLAGTATPSERRWAARTLLWRCAEARDGFACEAGADAYLAGRGVPMDLAVAMDLHAKGCALGMAGACYALANASMNGHHGMARDVSEGTRLMARALELYGVHCKNGELHICGFLEQLYSGTATTAVDVSRVAALRKFQCDAGHQPACAAGPLVDWRSDGGPLQSWELGCAKGRVQDCEDLGIYLGRAKNFPRDPSLAVVIGEWACKHGSKESCELGGDLLHGDAGLAANLLRAADLYREGCRLGSASICDSLADAVAGTHPGEAANARVRSIGLYAEACEAGDTPSCEYATYAYWSGEHVPKDVGRVVRLREVMCKAGDVAACSSVGRAYRYGLYVPRDINRALPYLEATCRKDPSSLRNCQELASIHELGLGVPKDPAKADEFRALSRASQRFLTAKGCLEHSDAGLERPDGGASEMLLTGPTVCAWAPLDWSCVERETPLDRYLMAQASEFCLCINEAPADQGQIAIRFQFSRDGGVVVRRVGEAAPLLGACVENVAKRSSFEAVVRDQDQVEYRWRVRRW